MLTVQDVLKRSLFSKTEVVAGANGLNRQVKWTHVLEIPFFDDTIFQGGELILSTGFGFEWRDSSNTSFLLNLIERNASCLCIELGHYFEEIPKEMIEMANEYNFPIIIFKEFINFVEIAQDLHSFIINAHHEKLVTLDSISREFHSLSLTTHGLSNILKLLQQKTEAPIIYLPIEGTPFSIPGLKNDFMEQLLQTIYEDKEHWHDRITNDSPVEWKALDHTILLQPIGAMDQIWAYLVMVLDRESDEFDFLILDRASLAISQDLLRKHYLDEKRLRLESTWLNDLLYRRINNEEQARGFISLKSKRTSIRYRIAIIDIEDVFHPSSLSLSDEENESAIYHYSLKIRSGFAKYSFTPYITSIRNQIIVLAIDLGTADSSKARFLKVIDTLLYVREGESSQIRIGVGRQYQLLLDAHTGYREAQLALNYRTFSTSAFYEDLGIFRLIQLIQHDQDTAHFIEDYLSPLINYDKEYGTELLLTLTKYFEFDRSKKLTAQKLHIVRQTLYHRMEKIKKILDFDFDMPENRLNVEMALKAYQLIQQGGVPTK
ncbi:PucR family transcriptional regulator ligand-binding domain-containing protein [Peribacillus butanolivorans]|uniref:PucR family transcriptional regulator n=1 Tax=Peribacillus butanolivorans TaxID=421767 RepID=UPI00207CF50C|nr:PucR family transcriptional regulator [Peribacillus butanolivorans]MCO0600152.1 PucR family transcriptional regulator ligand-binding domain-containing protein [Peribacillus butanolivorans]